MKRKQKKFDKRLAIGRDPTCGRVCFRTGATLTRVDRTRNRKTKLARRELDEQINGDG